LKNVKNLLISLLIPAFFPFPLGAQVVSVSWGAQNSNGLGDAAGSELPIGDLIRIGSFTLTDAQVQAAASNFSALNAAFVQYGTAAVGDGFGFAAHWAAVTSASTDSLGINGHRIYYWAFNAPSTGAATQYGVFTSTSPDWVFPSDGSIPNTTTTDLEQVDKILIGGFGSGTSTATGAALFNLVIIPEPSEAAPVVGLFCLTYFGYRRYRKPKRR
jgi:hypothetical protein